MSKFFAHKDLEPYVPGEQPRQRQYIKLNTNESPFPPSAKAQAYAAQAAKDLQLYSDPECTALTRKLSELYKVKPQQVLFSNGSDEMLFLAFSAFCSKEAPVVFPDITYGFYKVFAQLLEIPAVVIPLKEDFSVDVADYANAKGMVVIANPNAPTGLALSLEQIETLLQTNPNNVVLIDEAYVDFGSRSAVELIDKYENLLVVQTFSKSRSMAGARLGMAIGCEALIADLRTVKYSLNPYNVNAMTMAAGLGALEDEEYTQANCKTIMENRAFTTQALREMGFTALESATNFVLAGNPAIGGGELYRSLKEMGILVRFFDTPRLNPYVRITIGTRKQMEALLEAVKTILEEHT